MPELFTGDTITAALTPPAESPSSSASPTGDPSTTAADASSAEDAATTPQAVSADVSTVTTDPNTETAETTKSKGVPPEKEWPRILENARTKAATEAKAQYAWADRIPEPHRATVSEFYETLEAEPVKAIESLIATAASDPVHAPQLRSLLGRLLRGASPEIAPTETRAAQPAELPEPDFEDGQGHQFYSAARMREFGDALIARVDAKYRPVIEPIKTDYETREARARQAAERQRAQDAADKWAAERYAKVSKWDGFKDFEQEIHAAMHADPTLDVGDAYAEIVVPKLSLRERKKVVTSQQDKANASSVNPANPASAVQGPPKDFREGLLQMGVGA